MQVLNNSALKQITGGIIIGPGAIHAEPMSILGFAALSTYRHHAGSCGCGGLSLSDRDTDENP